jgi:hypothetical protein
MSTYERRQRLELSVEPEYARAGQDTATRLEGGLVNREVVECRVALAIGAPGASAGNLRAFARGGYALFLSLSGTKASLCLLVGSLELAQPRRAGGPWSVGLAL